MPRGDDSLAFQIGECSQIHTGGILQATPHAVRGPTGEGTVGISRVRFSIDFRLIFTASRRFRDGFASDLDLFR